MVLWDTWCHAHSHPRAGSLCSSVETPSDSKDSWGREVRAWSRVQAPGGGGSVWKRRKLYRCAGRRPQPGSGRTCDLAGTGSGLLVWMDVCFIWEVVVVGWRVRGCPRAAPATQGGAAAPGAGDPISISAGTELSSPAALPGGQQCPRSPPPCTHTPGTTLAGGGREEGPLLQSPKHKRARPFPLAAQGGN